MRGPDGGFSGSRSRRHGRRDAEDSGFFAADSGNVDTGRHHRVDYSDSVEYDDEYEDEYAEGEYAAGDGYEDDGYEDNYEDDLVPSPAPRRLNLRSSLRFSDVSEASPISPGQVVAVAVAVAVVMVFVVIMLNR